MRIENGMGLQVEAARGGGLFLGGAASNGDVCPTVASVSTRRWLLWICKNANDRDEIIQSGDLERPRDYYEYVAIRQKEVSMEVVRVV
jgi:hypothetical protein